MARKKVVRRQPKKDSSKTRVNFDNTRKSKFIKDVEEMEDKKKRWGDKSNDVSWYQKNPEIFRAAGQIGFVNVTGKELPWAHEAVPGIMTFPWVPSLGGSDQTAVNQAANSIYSFVVHANSRNQSYDATDLMMMILAGAQLFSLISHGMRVYGTMRRFDGMNEYTPEALVAAMGFNYSDLQSNLANMWFDLNHMIAQTAQIWIPNDIPLIERWYWMNNNIYMDAESTKGQFYMYIPDMFYTLSETATDTGTSLIPMMRPSNPSLRASFADPNVKTYWTWAEYLTFVQTAIDNLVKSQDRGIIMGDILKAYGQDHIYGLAPITSDYVTMPVYNREVLTQFENLTTFNYVPGNIVQNQVDLQVRQLPNEEATVQYSQLDGKTAANYKTFLQMLVPSNGVLNFHNVGQPTAEEIMVATRMQILGLAIDDASDSAGLSGIYPKYTGSEYCTHVNVYVYRYDILGTRKLSLTNLGTAFSVNKGKDSQDYQIFCLADGSLTSHTLGVWAAFDWAPAIYLHQCGDSTAPADIKTYLEKGQSANVIMEYDNYSIITPNELRKLHVAALLSLFGVPKI